MTKAKRNTVLASDEVIVNKIFFVREQKVMSDFDLAVLYEVETKRLNKQIKRNAERLSEEFMFRLNIKNGISSGHSL